MALHPPVDPYDSGHLPVGGEHRVYYEQVGRPDGQPVLFLHGGPGSGCRASHRQLFDPAHWRAVLFDQRGCGRSEPLASIDDNTIWHLIDDIEALRAHLGIERWLVFGGSWGSTLGLAYAEAHPEACTGLILRGISLNRPEDLPWWHYGFATFFPEVWEAFASHIPADERDDLAGAYHRRLLDPDPAVHMPAAQAMRRYESSCGALYPEPADPPADQSTLAKARIFSHYKTNGAFLGDKQLLDRIDRIRHLPGVIVQGRYDVICPIRMAHALHSAWPEAEYSVIPDAGHAVSEPGTEAALLAALDRFREAA